MFTQHQDPSPSTPGTIDQLSSSLIMSGIPSNAFSIREFTRNNTAYVFLEPTFEKTGNEFTTARWVWLITYDNRFLATTGNGAKGYALPKHEIADIAGRLHIIDSDPVAALHTYFIDHNLNPEHITVSISGDYISMPEDEVQLTVEYTPLDTVPDEAQNLELDGWDEATESESLTPTTGDSKAVTISVAAARDLIANRFDGLNEKYWESQSKDIEWSLTS